MASRMIRPGSGRAWIAAGIAALLLAIAAGVPLALISAAVRTAEGWSGLGLAILAAFIMPIGGLSILLVVLAIALIVPRWARRARSRGAGIWMAAGAAAAAAAVASLLTSVAFVLQLAIDGGFLAFAAFFGGAAALIAAIGGAIGWAIAGIGVDTMGEPEEVEPSAPAFVHLPQLLLGAAAAAIAAVVLRQAYSLGLGAALPLALGGGPLVLSIVEGLLIAFLEWLAIGALLTLLLGRFPAWVQVLAYFVVGGIVSMLPMIAVYGGRTEFIAFLALMPIAALTGVAFVVGWAVARWAAKRAVKRTVVESAAADSSAGEAVSDDPEGGRLGGA